MEHKTPADAADGVSQECQVPCFTSLDSMMLKRGKEDTVCSICHWGV